MTYEACLAYIHGRPRFSSRRTDLSKVERLLERLGSPHRQGRFVHVTGTNGKGSACAFVALRMAALSHVRKGPPEQVRRILSMGLPAAPCKH